MMLLYLLNSWEGERNLSEFTGKTSRSVWGKFACLLVTVHWAGSAVLSASHTEHNKVYRVKLVICREMS